MDTSIFANSFILDLFCRSGGLNQQPSSHKLAPLAYYSGLLKSITQLKYLKVTYNWVKCPVSASPRGAVVVQTQVNLNICLFEDLMAS